MPWRAYNPGAPVALEVSPSPTATSATALGRRTFGGRDYARA